jgi:hypothetical protein
MVTAALILPFLLGIYFFLHKRCNPPNYKRIYQVTLASDLRTCFVSGVF